LANALRESGSGAILRNEPLDLAIVKDDARGLIAKQPASLIGKAGDDEVGRDVHQPRLDTDCLANFAVELIPSFHFIGGDVKRLANRLLVPEQAREAFGEIAVVSNDPQRRTVARHDDFLAAEHAVNDGVRHLRTVDDQRNCHVAERQRRADDGNREGVLTMGSPQALFAGNFVAGVFPVGIAEGRRFCDQIIGGRPLVRARRADENELARAAAEKVDVALDISRRVRDPIDDCIEDEPSQTRTTDDLSLMSALSVLTPGGNDASRRPRVRSVSSIPRCAANFVHAVLIVPVPPMNNTFIPPFVTGTSLVAPPEIAPLEARVTLRFAASLPGIALDCAV